MDASYHQLLLCLLKISQEFKNLTEQSQQGIIYFKCISKYEKVGVLPIRIVKSNVSSIGPSSERNIPVPYIYIYGQIVH